MSTKTWKMHAGRDPRNGGFRNFGHPRYVEMYGNAEVIPILLTEDPDGPYYGWIDADRTEPTMIQQHEGMFSMQFPYGPDAEVKAGRGRVVRLTAAEVES
jgi:hypothetical protein